MENANLNNRSCLHCGALIAKNDHGNLKFCPRVELEDGSIQCCKDDYHSSRKKVRDEPYRKIALFHKRTTNKIALLLADKGDEISLEELTSYGIVLSRSFDFSMDDKGHSTFYFVVFGIRELINKKYKIFTHELSY